MNTGKRKSCALLNRQSEESIAMAASRLGNPRMRLSARILALAFGSILTVAPASNAFAQGLHKIGTLAISGVTQRPVTVFSAGVQYALSQGTTAAQFSVFTLSKRVDATSPILLASSASGRRIQSANVAIFRADGTTVLTRYELTDIVVMGAVVKSVRSGNTNVLIEEVSLDYTKIKQTVFTSSGPVETCWDRAQNAAC